MSAAAALKHKERYKHLPSVGATMRGLPFPSETLFNREQSLDFGSPVPNGAPVLTDVVLPLDPALGGPSSAPPYYPPVNGVNGQEIHSFNEVIVYSRTFVPYLSMSLEGRDATRRRSWLPYVFNKCTFC